MQYGNMTISKKILRLGISFKSYYVVWKQSLPAASFAVYSLNRTMQYGNLLLLSKCVNVMVGLNRTMQYGNFSFWQLCVVSAYSLNRTMQYGNHFVHNRYVVCELSLNRTMQYGNPERICMSGRGRTFKSYYVVWKRLEEAPEYQISAVFKSYYVVWKH